MPFSWLGTESPLPKAEALPLHYQHGLQQSLIFSEYSVPTMAVEYQAKSQSHNPKQREYADTKAVSVDEQKTYGTIP